MYKRSVAMLKAAKLCNYNHYSMDRFYQPYKETGCIWNGYNTYYVKHHRKLWLW